MENFSQGREGSPDRLLSPSPKLIWLLEEPPADWRSSELSAWILQDKVQ